ncbi:MAG: Gfo/Idh/MocA family oxidoreductase [Chloroflexi bacterium]|nr:Gfo/Idh/MocA family oxidoreductase [Chloroflexota bacterium]
MTATAQPKLRVGVVGANGHPERWGARVHVPVFQALPEVELKAVCTAHEETAQAAARRFGVDRAYSDYRRLVEDPDIDLVSVAVRVPDHHPICMAALAAGKHVLCEWPLALNAAHAQEMEKAASARALYGTVDLQSRFSPGVLLLRELLARRFVGDLVTFNMVHFVPNYIRPVAPHRAWIARADSGGGALTIQTGHATDVLQWCLGERIAAVLGHTRTARREWDLAGGDERVPVTSPDNVAFVARMDSGAVGSVQVSVTAWHGGGWRLEVYGAEGKLAASCPGMLMWTPVRVSGATKGDTREAEFRPGDSHVFVHEFKEEDVPFNVAQLVRTLVRSMRNGAPFAPGFSEAVHLHRTLEAVQRSSTTGGWVSVS